MDGLSDTLENLRDTQAQMALTRAELEKHPHRTSLAAAFQSLEQRHSELEREFAVLVQKNYSDLCSYRLFQADHFQPLISAIGTALVDFQRWVSVVYDAVKHGPKRKTKLPVDVVAESSFSFGYSYTGSLGIVMTVPNDHLLLEDMPTALDDAINGVLEMATCVSSDQVAYFSKKFGPSAIRQMLKWAKTHQDQRMGADIEWKRKDARRTALIMEPEQFAALTLAICETSDEEISLMRIPGTLVGISTKTHTFQLEAPEIGIVSGKTSDYVATMNNTVELPKEYEAELRKTVKINYAIEEEEVSWFLVDLTPI